MDASLRPPRAAASASIPPAEAAPNATLDNLSLDAYIDLYFEAEEAGERDFVLAKICAHQDPEALPFLLALLAQEDDIFLRLAAAEALMGRGVQEARDVLVGALHAAGDDEVFREAMEALLRGCGAAMFADLAEIYADAGRDWSERLAAMHGMERADAQQAQATFLRALAQIPGAKPFDAAELEAMLGCFVREETAGVADALQALIGRLQAGQASNWQDDVRVAEAALAVVREAGA